jgi:hypothetical protein
MVGRRNGNFALSRGIPIPGFPFQYPLPRATLNLGTELIRLTRFLPILLDGAERTAKRDQQWTFGKFAAF